FLLFPPRLHSVATTSRCDGGAGAHDWSCGWRLDQRDLVVAVAVSDQRRAGGHCRGPHAFLLPRTQTRFADLATLDVLSLAMMVIALASLEIGLKEAPHGGWLSPVCSVLFVISAAAATVFAVRTLKVLHPMVELSTLRKRSFAIGCALSFCL